MKERAPDLIELHDITMPFRLCRSKLASIAASCTLGTCSATWQESGRAREGGARSLDTVGWSKVRMVMLGDDVQVI